MSTESSRSAQWYRSLRRPTYETKACQVDPDRRSARAQRDEWLRGEIDRVWKANFEVYGAEKVWK